MLCIGFNWEFERAMLDWEGKYGTQLKTKWVVGEVVEDGPRTHPKEMRSLKWNCILVYQLGEPKTTRNL